MITLILADDLEKGTKIAQLHQLNVESCAVITEPYQLDYVSLIPDETVYADANTELLVECVNKMHQMPKFTNLNIKIVNA